MATKAAVTAPEPRQTVAEQYTEFESAFAEALAPAETTEPAVATISPEDSDAAKSAEGSEVSVADGAGTEAADEAGTATPAEPSVAPVETEEETPEAKIARLEAENTALKQPKPVEPEPAKASEPAPAVEPEPTGPVEPQWYQPSDEEKQLLAKHQENWPDISAAEAVRTKQAVYNAVQYVFAKIAENYNPVLKRFDEMSTAISEQMTLGALRSEHQDYDEIYDKVVAWTDTLPVAFRLGAKHVMKEGTPEEVAELISTYKQQAGTQAPAASNAVPTVATRTTGLSAPAKKAAKALTVVGSQRTSPVQTADVNDFDAAWKESLTG